MKKRKKRPRIENESLSDAASRWERAKAVQWFMHERGDYHSPIYKAACDEMDDAYRSVVLARKRGERHPTDFMQPV